MLVTWTVSSELHFDDKYCKKTQSKQNKSGGRFQLHAVRFICTKEVIIIRSTSDAHIIVLYAAAGCSSNCGHRIQKIRNWKDLRVASRRVGLAIWYPSSCALLYVFFSVCQSFSTESLTSGLGWLDFDENSRKLGRYFVVNCGTVEQQQWTIKRRGWLSANQYIRHWYSFHVGTPAVGPATAIDMCKPQLSR